MKNFTITILISAAFQFGNAQEHRIPAVGEGISVGHKSEIMIAPLYREIQVNPKEAKWKTHMQKIATYHNSPDSIEAIKAAKSKLKNSAIVEDSPTGNGRATNPILGTNFLGNQIPNGTPPDNAMAISNGGRIVSSDNGTIEYYTENGQYLLIDESHYDFFNDNSLNGNIFDPRLIYDSQADRFIFVILHGSSSSTSKILVAFSKTNNPSNGWWMYTLSGNPLNNSTWTDYPSIGVSNNELYITGNLFTDSDNFDQSIIYQIGKAEGYSGQSLNYQLWNDIEDGQGGSAFSLIPLSYGQQGNYGPGIYFASSRSGGHNRIYIYDLTDDLTSSNEQLIAYNVFVPSYSPAADAFQPNNAPDLNNNDCRLQHGFYLNGMLHIVHHADYNNTAYNGIKYYRVPVANLSNAQTASYGENGKDCAFPSIASYGLTANETGVMIGYLGVSSTETPGMRAINCDASMNWSSPTIIKNGDTFINYTWTSGVERWGDYSDMQRKHNATDPEVWMSGCFGATSPVNHTWNTWIAEIKGDFVPTPFPEVDFVADTTVNYNPAIISFFDSTTNAPNFWSWTFQGAVPNNSQIQNPIITYNDTGFFDVTLIAGNQFGSDTLTKIAYITILNSDTVVIFPESIDEVEIDNLKIYPNPVRSSEILNFEIEVYSFSNVRAEIFDIQGRTIKILFDDMLRPGIHRLSFNSLALPAGQYSIRFLINNEFSKDEKIIIQY